MKIVHTLSASKYIKSVFIRFKPLRKHIIKPFIKPFNIINKREVRQTLFKQKNLFVHSNTCLYCDNFKYTRCLECYGNGRTYENTKEFLCEDCKGSGHIKCLYC